MAEVNGQQRESGRGSLSFQTAASFPAEHLLSFIPIQTSWNLEADGAAGWCRVGQTESGLGRVDGSPPVANLLAKVWPNCGPGDVSGFLFRPADLKKYILLIVNKS